jgi:hypothetical protein
MNRLDVIKLAASKLAESGAALWQAVRAITNDVDDVEPFGEIDVFQGLGLSSMPFPADEEGHAEGVIVENCGNMNAVCIGARDTRTAKITGNLKPGDTVLHSTGPSQAAQVQCKEEKRQVVQATKNMRGETQATILDGKNEKYQVAVGGCMLECADGGWTFTDATGKASIIIRNGQINLVGRIVLGGLSPIPGLSIMLGPVAGSPGAGAAAPMFAAKGVFVGL